MPDDTFRITVGSFSGWGNHKAISTDWRGQKNKKTINHGVAACLERRGCEHPSERRECEELFSEDRMHLMIKH